MWARIRNNKAIEVINFDPAGKYHENIIWDAVPDEVKQNWTTDGANWYPPEIVAPETSVKKLSAMKIRLLSQLDSKATRIKERGITVDGDRFKTDFKTQSRFSQAVQRTDKDAAVVFNWKLRSGEFKVLDKTTINTILDAMFTHTQATFTNEKNLTDTINACTTQVSLKSVDINTGW